MDLKILPSELVQEILDRVPFSEWLDSIILVCKEWKKLCETSRSQNKCLIVNDSAIVKSWKTIANVDVIRSIISKYQITGLSWIERIYDQIPSDLLTASKQLKWLTLSRRGMESVLNVSEPLNIEKLSFIQCFEKFPKVRVFSMHPPFNYVRFKPPLQDVQVAPVNTEIMYTSTEYQDQHLYTFLDTIAKGLPRLKLELEDIIQIYETLESYMEKKFGVRLVIRSPFVLAQHFDLFKDEHQKTGFPYDYWTPHLKLTVFSHACSKEALDTMKYLIDTGIVEKELLFQSSLPAYDEYHELPKNVYLASECPPFYIVPGNFLELGPNHKEILDYLMSLGLTCDTKAPKRYFYEKAFYESFGVSHPVVAYVTLQSPPHLAAKTIHEIMQNESPHYRTYLHEMYFKASKEIQNEVKKLLVDFDFSDVLYYVIESRDLQTIKHVVGEFNIDLTKYHDAINECPAMEDCIEISDYVNNLLN